MYTDTEVLFGIAEVKRTDSDMERKMSAEFDRLTLMNTLDNLLEGYITRAVARREMHKVEVSTLEAKVAGAGYTLLTGVSIEDLQVAGVTLEAVEGMLDDEVFMSIEEKHEKLDPYIVYVDETSARLEPVEIMQLLSVAKHTRK